MTWQQEINSWLEGCQQAGGLHMISSLPDPGKAPSISFVCIPSFPGNPIPDDLRVRLRPDQFLECVEHFPGFPNVMTMIGDGWLYWRPLLEGPLSPDWVHTRTQEAIRITVHQSLSLELLIRLLGHEDLYEGARCICLELESGGGMALFDNPKVNAVYAMQKIQSDIAFAELQKLLVRLEVTQIEDPKSVVDFELLYWIIQREFNAPGQAS